MGVKGGGIEAGKEEGRVRGRGERGEGGREGGVGRREVGIIPFTKYCQLVLLCRLNWNTPPKKREKKAKYKKPNYTVSKLDSWSPARC